MPLSCSPGGSPGWSCSPTACSICSAGLAERVCGRSWIIWGLSPTSFRIGEVGGSLALLAGVLTRFSAVSLIIIMVGAIVIGHAQHGFFMNWYGTSRGKDSSITS